MDGDIWLLQVGVNLGSEIDGKGSSYARPVYVFRKINKDTFIGIPLTTSERSSIDRFKITNRKDYLIFFQIKSFSSKRCLRLIEATPVEEIKRIKEVFHRVFCV